MANVTRNLINRLKSDNPENVMKIYGKLTKVLYNFGGCSTCTVEISNAKESYQLHNVEMLTKFAENIIPSNADEAIVDFTVPVPYHLGLLLKENDELFVDLSVYTTKELYFTVLTTTIYRNGAFIATVPLDTAIYYLNLWSIVRYA